MIILIQNCFLVNVLSLLISIGLLISNRLLSGSKATFPRQFHFVPMYAVLIILSMLYFTYAAMNFANVDEWSMLATLRSLATTGQDLQGNTHAVYSNCWGYGIQTMLYDYIALPFCAIFGYSLPILRIPQLIIWLTTAIVSVEYIRRVKSEKIAWYSLLIICLSPWFYTTACTALDADLMLPLVTLGLIFLDWGITRKRNKYVYISMIFFGLSYWSYALAMLFTTVILISAAIYLLVKHKISVKALLISMLICISVGYCAIAGYVYLVLGWQLPNIMQMPECHLTRTDDVGISAVNIILNLLKATFFLPEYSIWDIAACYSGTYPILFAIAGVVFVPMLLCNLSKIKEHKTLGLYFIGYLVLQCLVLSGTRIRYTTYFPAAIVLIAASLVSLRRNWIRRVFVGLSCLNLILWGICLSSFPSDDTALKSMRTSACTSLADCIEYMSSDYSDVELNCLFTDEYIVNTGCLFAEDRQYVCDAVAYAMSGGNVITNVYGSLRTDYEISDANMRDKMSDISWISYDSVLSEGLYFVPEGFSLDINLSASDSYVDIIWSDGYFSCYSICGSAILHSIEN